MFQIKHTITGTEPLLLADVKSFLKVEYTLDDAFITDLITAARRLAELYCNRSLIADTIEYYTTDSEDSYLLPYPEHDAIAEVKISDLVITDYTKTGLSQFTIIPNTNTTVTPFSLYVKYSTTGKLPEGIKSVLMKIVADMYENRNDQQLSKMAMALLLPYKVYQ